MGVSFGAGTDAPARVALHNEIIGEARRLAEEHDLGTLAVLMAEYTPKERTKWVRETKVPWALIYAVRIKIGALG